MTPNPTAPSAATAIQMTAARTLFICGNFTPPPRVVQTFRLRRGFGGPPAAPALLGGRDLKLLELAVRHDERGQAQRLRAAFDAERARHHAAAQRLVGLLELLRGP